MPFALMNSAMAESPDGRGVLVFGGSLSDGSFDFSWNYTDKILELRAGTNSWKILDITLKNERSNLVVVPLQ